MGHSLCTLPVDLGPLTSPLVVERMRRLKVIGEGFTRDDGPRVEKALVELLSDDPDPIVRHEAAFLLSDLMRRDLIGGNLARPALWSATQDGSILVRHESALSLAAFPCAATIALLLRLREEDKYVDVRLSAELALEELNVERPPLAR